MNDVMFPLRDVVIIERDKTDETEGGIALMESFKDPAGTDSGEVLSINGNYYNENGFFVMTTPVHVGDRVLFLRKHGIAVKGSKTKVCVRYDNLLAVFEH